MDELTSRESTTQEIHEFLRWLRADGLIERVAVRSSSAAAFQRRLDDLRVSVNLRREGVDSAAGGQC